MMDLSNIKLSVIGLGPIGIPLAVKFDRKPSGTGFDFNEKRMADFQTEIGYTLELESEKFNQAQLLTDTTNPEAYRTCNCFIIDVPTEAMELRL